MSDIKEILYELCLKADHAKEPFDLAPFEDQILKSYIKKSDVLDWIEKNKSTRNNKTEYFVDYVDLSNKIKESL